MFLSKITKEAFDNFEMQVSIARSSCAYPGMYFRQVIEKVYEYDPKEAELLYNSFLFMEPSFTKGALFCNVPRKVLCQLTNDEIQEVINFFNTKPLFVMGI